ncbi:hypothetical protein GALL_452200 [mine drainage metagenome]|uniref:DNA-binding protein n=1 Tax=mine drainage metagenome TaxID=410659 RepID=A0A1J5QAZ9_9ZZZZ
MEQPAIATPAPDTMLRRADAATALRAAGYPTTKATLATLATRGGGPTYRKFGAIPLYRWSDLLDWAHGKLSAPMQSTSTGDVQAKAA